MNLYLEIAYRYLRISKLDPLHESAINEYVLPQRLNKEVTLMAKIANRVQHGNAAFFLNLLDQVIDGHQSSGSTHSSTTMNEDGSAICAVILVQTAKETKDAGGVFRCLEIFPDKVVVLEYWTYFTFHDT